MTVRVGITSENVLRDVIDTKEIALLTFRNIEDAFDNTTYGEIQNALIYNGAKSILTFLYGCNSPLAGV